MGGEQPAPEGQCVAMGQMGIPALGRGKGPRGAQAPLGHSPGAAPQALADAQQTGVAQADAAADYVKAHEGCACGGAMQLSFAGMEPQAQGRQIGDQQLAGLAQGLRVIGEEGQIIHVAQTGPDARQGAEVVIEGIEVQVGQELAGEVADGRPRGRCSGVSRVSPGKASMAGPQVAPFATIARSSQRVPGQVILCSSWASNSR